jgi:hypothetical protein
LDKYFHAAVAVGVLSLGAVVTAERDTSIPYHVRENGSFERIIVTTDKPVLLADLVGTADLVIEGSATALRTYLDGDETHIYTDYTFTVAEIVKNRRRPGLMRPGQTIVVRRESGTVLVGGLPATTIENGFPAFRENGSYLLFLKELRDENTYQMLAGGRGAFESGEEILPMMSLPTETPAHRAPRQSFLGEVRALLKFTE